MKQKIAQGIAAWFILLFVYTAVSKLSSQPAFEKVMSESVLLKHFSTALSWALPATELLVAALLVFPSTRRAGLYLSLLLMVLFTMYISWMLVYEPKLPCSCGGVIMYLNWRQHLVFNMACIALAIAGIRTIPWGVSQKPIRE